MSPTPRHPRPAGIPPGYADCDPRTARRVPLTQPLHDGVPLYPGDPEFAWTIAVDTRDPAEASGGYVVERVTSMGTHTATHVSAPAHVLHGGATMADLDEGFTLMPLAVCDVRARIAASGPDFQVSAADLQEWERIHGRIPAGGCVLLLTGHPQLAADRAGERSAYVTTPAPGFAGSAVAWLVTERGIRAVGSDTLGPDATSDVALSATTRALGSGVLTVENVGAGLAAMRPHGDWIGINGNRPPFSGFPVGVTGYTAM